MRVEEEEKEERKLEHREGESTGKERAGERERWGGRQQQCCQLLAQRHSQHAPHSHTSDHFNTLRYHTFPLLLFFLLSLPLTPEVTLCKHSFSNDRQEELK